ncbi:MAG: putative metal-binding motif-containing protein, partial [Nanoarchaeota archaeon]
MRTITSISLIIILFLLIICQGILLAGAYDVNTETTRIYGSLNDGVVWSECSSDWSTVYGADIGQHAMDMHTSYSSSMSAEYSTYGFCDGKKRIFRGFLYFDTSEVEGEIQSATLNVYSSNMAESSVVVQKGVQSDTLTKYDFDAFEGDEYGYVLWQPYQYNSIELNVLGVSNINQEGITKLCLREYDHDFLNQDIGTKSYHNSIYFSDSDNKPYLDITYTLEPTCVPVNSAVVDTTCDGIDDDCDGNVDEDYVSDVICFLSGSCAAFNIGSSCVAGVETVCSTGTPVVEICDGQDNDCNDLVDDGVLINYYQDDDSDGYGNPTISTQACSAPSGYVEDNTDCNDANTDINYEIPEVCNGIDDNCATGIDENNICGVTSYYCDVDTDTYISSIISGSCNTFNCIPVGCTDSQGNDCNDGDININPGKS